MAKARVTCGNVTVEGEDQKEIFRALAEYQEVFSIAKCKGCGSDNLRFSVRRQADAKGKEHTYYELRCLDCYAKLPYGQHDNGQTLFPKKWVRYDRETSQEVEL
jgi:ribosomal protein L40E